MLPREFLKVAFVFYLLTLFIWLNIISVCVCKSMCILWYIYEDQKTTLGDLILSFHLVGPGDGTQVVRIAPQDL